MQSKATVRHLRIAPRKVRLMAELLRGKKVEEVKAILHFSHKRVGRPLAKVLLAALGAATHNVQLDEANLYIAQLQVHEGPKLKRYRPRARGRAYPVQKKTSHITLVLDEIVPSEKSAESPKGIQADLPPAATSSAVGGVGERKISKPNIRPEKEVRQARRISPIQRIFRRKAI